MSIKLTSNQNLDINGKVITLKFPDGKSYITITQFPENSEQGFMIEAYCKGDDEQETGFTQHKQEISLYSTKDADNYASLDIQDGKIFIRKSVNGVTSEKEL